MTLIQEVMQSGMIFKHKHIDQTVLTRRLVLLPLNLANKTFKSKPF